MQDNSKENEELKEVNEEAEEYYFEEIDDLETSDNKLDIEDVLSEEKIELLLKTSNQDIRDELLTLFNNNVENLLSYKDSDNQTILHTACKNSKKPLIKFLLNRNKITKSLKSRDSPQSGVFIKKQQPNESSIYKNFVNSIDKYKNSAFDLVNSENYHEIAKLFLNCDDFNIHILTSTKKQNFIHKLIEKNHQQLICYLVARRKEADFSTLDGKGNSPLKIACSNANHEMVGLLVNLANNRYINFNSEDFKDRSKELDLYNKIFYNKKKTTNTLMTLGKNIILKNFYYEFLFESIYVNFLRASHKESKINRRLDSLAKLIQGKGICTAVCLYKGKLLISSNNGKNLAHMKNVINYFKSLIKNLNDENKNKNNIQNILCNAALPTINTVYRNDKKNKFLELKENLKQVMWDIYVNIKELQKIITTKETNVGKIKELLGKYNIEINITEGKNLLTITEILVGIARNLKKLEKLLLEEKTGDLKTLLSNYKVGNKTKKRKVIFLNENPNTKKNEEIHAEMRILQYILGSIKEPNDISGNLYIGISKLCCGNCNIILNALSKNHENWTKVARGSSGRSFSWPIPNFLKKDGYFDKIFAHNPGLIKAFNEAIKENKDATFEIIEKVEDVSKVTTLLNNRKNKMEFSISSSEIATTDENRGELGKRGKGNFTILIEKKLRQQDQISPGYRTP